MFFHHQRKVPPVRGKKFPCNFLLFIAMFKKREFNLNLNSTSEVCRNSSPSKTSVLFNSSVIVITHTSLGSKVVTTLWTRMSYIRMHTKDQRNTWCTQYTTWPVCVKVCVCEYSRQIEEKRTYQQHKSSTPEVAHTTPH